MSNKQTQSLPNLPCIDIFEPTSNLLDFRHWWFRVVTLCNIFVFFNFPTTCCILASPKLVFRPISTDLRPLVDFHFFTYIQSLIILWYHVPVSFGFIGPWFHHNFPLLFLASPQYPTLNTPLGATTLLVFATFWLVILGMTVAFHSILVSVSSFTETVLQGMHLLQTVKPDPLSGLTTMATVLFSSAKNCIPPVARLT